MPAPKVSKDVRCIWRSRGGSESDVYDCVNCHGWTANLPLYRFSLCPAKDRRKAERDRRSS